MMDKHRERVIRGAAYFYGIMIGLGILWMLWEIWWIFMLAIIGMITFVVIFYTIGYFMEWIDNGDKKTTV